MREQIGVAAAWCTGNAQPFQGCGTAVFEAAETD
jgi:hypothetical protein